MALIRFLVIAFLIYIGFKLVVRFVLPLFGRYVVKKMSQNLQEQRAQQQHGEKIYQDNHIVIRKNQSRDGKGKKGPDEEYVDYQEVK